MDRRIGLSEIHQESIQPARAASDAELLAAARAGSDEAFRVLVQRYEAAVAGVVIGMLGHGDEADDVGQEVFIRFHAALHRFRGEATLGTYLRRIALNLSLNALKRRRRARLRLVSRDQHSGATLPEPAIPPYDAERAEQRALMREAIARLSEKYRSVVVLRGLEGLSTNEAAEVLGVPPGTIMSRLARGMVELERLLAPYVRGGPDAP